jgi:hypothetical protein
MPPELRGFFIFGRSIKGKDALSGSKDLCRGVFF